MEKWHEDCFSSCPDVESTISRGRSPMGRYGWILIAVGLIIAGVVGLNFAAYCLADPQRNDPLTGFLSMVGVWIGLITAGVGAVFVARARGVPTPPI
jgi:hypothetical protein